MWNPVDVSEAEERQFRKGTSGYYGHHADKLDSGPRVFEEVISDCMPTNISRGDKIRPSQGKQKCRVALGSSASASVSFSKENG